MKNDIATNCLYFVSTSDMWSSQTMKAFMALTIHFVTPDFKMRNYTLEVKPVTGKHTGENITDHLEKSFLRWSLEKSKLSMMLKETVVQIW